MGIGTITPVTMLDIKTYGSADGFNIIDGSNKVLMRLNSVGQLILGANTSTPTIPTINSNYPAALLQVKGDVVVGTNGLGANIWVTQTAWSDFVFDINYKLMPLNEVESFYKANHHLLNVPTQKEIQENGNNLGQTDVVLLQKIEENTIYIVELNKKIEVQDKKLEAQQKLIEALAKKLEDKK